MKAVLLAAGVGRRLGRDDPKCLLRFGGRSLVERHIANLQRAGIKELVLVVGFQAQLIRSAVSALDTRLPIRFVVNADYCRGSVISLLAALDQLQRGDDILIMDADVLYAYSILERLKNTPLANCFLLDRDLPPGDEPVKLCVRGGRLVEFSKQPRADIGYDFAGESVGFFRFADGVAGQLAESAQRYAMSGRVNAPYEDVIRDLVLARPADFGFEDVSGMPWIEIDFPEDVARAEREILPRISRDE